MEEEIYVIFKDQLYFALEVWFSIFQPINFNNCFGDRMNRLNETMGGNQTGYCYQQYRPRLDNRGGS